MPASREYITEIAYDMLDFCEGLLSTKTAEIFWKERDYNITAEERNTVFFVACMLLK